MQRGLATSAEQNFSILMEIPSYPLAFLMFNLLIIEIIESSVKYTVLSLQLVVVVKGGKTLAFSRGLHC